MTRLIEQDRRAYLAALGIPVWTRRQPLQCAGAINLGDLTPPPRSDYQVAPESLLGMAAPTSVALVPAPGESVLSAAPLPLAAESVPDTDRPAVGAPAPAFVLSNDAVPPPADDLPFVAGFPTDDKPQLRFWWYQLGTLVLVDDAPLLLDDAQRQRLLSLAHNLMRCCQVRDDAPQLTQMQWPVFSHPLVPQSSQQVLEYFRHKLMQQQQMSPYARLLLAGDRSQRYFSRQPEVELWQRLVLPSVSALAMPSLSQLLAMPDYKRDFWQQWQQWTDE